MHYSTQQIYFDSNGNRLVGTLYKTLVRAKSPGILFLHGAGTSSSARFDEWQKYICDRGYTSFIFDCTGVGKSGGKFEDSSLNSRLTDTENALKTFIGTGLIDENNISVFGNSMSGHTAIRLTQKSKSVKALILAYAAAYSEEAENKKFGQAFTNAIRKENSWVNSPVFRILENYSGKTLVVYGENENIIPVGVQKKYRQLVKDKGESFIVKNAGHRMILPTNEKEEIAMRELFKISADYLDKTFGTR